MSNKEDDLFNKIFIGILVTAAGAILGAVLTRDNDPLKGLPSAKNSGEWQSSIKAIKCRHCQADNESHEDICFNCGQKLVPPKPSPAKKTKHWDQRIDSFIKSWMSNLNGLMNSFNRNWMSDLNGRIDSFIKSWMSNLNGLMNSFNRNWMSNLNGRIDSFIRSWMSDLNGLMNSFNRNLLSNWNDLVAFCEKNWVWITLLIMITMALMLMSFAFPIFIAAL